jgi:hypothetical protein
VTGQITSNRPGQRARGSVEPRHSAATLNAALEISPSRAESKHSITFQVRETGSFFRIQPVRDPNQPRFWCASVRQCSSGGILDEAMIGWIDRPGMTQAQLSELIEVIRADLGNWLAEPARRDLCDWLLTAKPLATAAQLAGVRDVAPRSR